MLRALKADAALTFDYLRCLTGVDNEADGIDVVYHALFVRRDATT